MSEYYIAHHGIKGMKWGIRRYQNTDGSYTSAGKARRAHMDRISGALMREGSNSIKKSEYNKLHKTWKKKHPNDDEDSFGDYLMDRKYNQSKDYYYNKGENLKADAYRLSRNYPRIQAKGAAGLSAITAAPIVGYGVNRIARGVKASEKATALATGAAYLGTIGLNAVNAYRYSKKDQEKMYNKYKNKYK